MKKESNGMFIAIISIIIIIIVGLKILRSIFSSALMVVIALIVLGIYLIVRDNKRNKLIDVMNKRGKE